MPSTNFAGYLLKAVTTDTIFPHNYIALESWSSTPDQREELKAYRDDNTRNLTRVTAAGKKSVFSFETRDKLNLADKMAIQKFFTDAESDHEQRKIRLQFWNEETNSYDVGDFYRPNMDFSIYRITEDDIIYKSLKFEFIEY